MKKKTTTTVSKTRGRPRMFGVALEQTPVGLNLVQRERLSAIQQCEFNRTRMTPSVSELIRAAIDHYTDWYARQYGVELLAVREGNGGGDGKTS